MLITKEVEVKLHSSNIKYYEDLDYPIPREKVKNKYVVRKGTTIIVKIQDLQISSNVLVEYECDYCGTRKQIPYSEYNSKNNKLSKDCCIDCLGKYKSELNKIQWEEKLKSEFKICSKCKREFPKTNEYFNKNVDRPDDFTCRCKECINNKIIFGIEKEVIPEGFKKCLDCGEILEINENNFKTYVKSKDGYYNICINCQINRRHKDAIDGYKICKSCNRELPINRDFYDIDDRCLDGYRGICRECNGEDFYPEFKAESWNQYDINIIIENYEQKTIKDILPLLTTNRTEKAVLHIASKLNLRKNKNFIDGYKQIQYKIVDNNLLKLCKCCEEYLPNNKLYFPEDIKCTNNLRNVCRLCKGEKYLFDSNVHIWNQDEINIIINNYSNMTNTELKNTYFPYLSINKIMSKGNNLNLYKSEETLNKMFKEIGKITSDRLLFLERWKGEDNPQYNSQRFGELNPNYKGGISALYQELRRNIKQWKLDSMENCNYKCFLSNNRFDHIHHLYSFESIVKDTLEETGLPLYENISWYTQDELQKLIDKCLEIHYRHPLGICLEEKYHMKFHSEFSYGNNTPEQFYEFIENYYNGDYKDLLNIG